MLVTYRSLAVFLFVLAAVACGASFDGPATAPSTDPKSCSGHLDCGSGGCCAESDESGDGWICGSAAFEGCPVGSCCFTGQGVGPGDMGARKPHAYPLRPRS